jgi:hypothetical protein
MEFLSDMGHVDSCFSPFGDSVCAKCTIGSEIILDAPGGTPR